MPILVEILLDKLIPWSQHNAAERFIVGRSKMGLDQMPHEVHLKRRKINSQRVVVKNLRLYDNQRGVSASWPEAGLNEVSKMKLACVFGGHVDYQLGNYAVQCGAGHFILIPPGMPHPDGSQSYIDTEKSTFCDVLLFLLHSNAFECWVSHHDELGRKQTTRYLILNEHLTSLFQTLTEELIAGEEDFLQIGEKLLNGFFIMLRREVDAGRFQQVRSGTASREHEARRNLPGKDNFATRLELYVQANLQKPLTLESVSREMLLSRTQFTRTVRRETGKSFHEILTEHRIKEAKRLLRESPWTVTAIASLVGFKSVSHFRTFFHQRTSQTPTEFRFERPKNKKT